MNDNYDPFAPKTPSAKFLTIGTIHKGKVVRREQLPQKDIHTGVPLTYSDGNTKMQVAIEIAPLDGTENITIWAKGAMLHAIKAAIKAAGAPTLETGGTLAVKYTGDGTPKTAGFNAPKEYVAQYVSPAVSGDDLLGATNPTPQVDMPGGPVDASPVTANDLL